MTHDELKTKVEELEVLIKSGKDYDQAETQARELLAENALVNEPELHCRTLLALSQSLRQRGIAKEALPYAEQALALAEQEQNKKQKARVLNDIGNVHFSLSDYSLALEYYGKALALAEEFGNKAGMATHLGNIGNSYFYLSDYQSALEYMIQALTAYDELGDQNGIAKIMVGLGSVYFYLSDYSRTLEYCGKALVAYEKLGHKVDIANVNTRIGMVWQNLGDYVRALEYFEKAYNIHRNMGNKSGAAVAVGNIGYVFMDIEDYNSALEYYGKAYELFEELGDKVNMARGMTNVGKVYRKIGDYARALEYMRKAYRVFEEFGLKIDLAQVLANIGALYSLQSFEGYDEIKAEEYLHKAIVLKEQLGTKHKLYEDHKALAELYEQKQQMTQAFFHFKKFHELEKEVQNDEAKKQAEKLDFERKQAEYEKHIIVERAASQARIEEQEKLLHNVLPPTIAERLLKKETFIADYYPSVSVLFMDLVNFTRIASIVPPKHLIYVLNTIFRAADNIMEQYGLEKIKTIGDAYMAVSGAPIVQDDHALRAAAASIALLDRMNTLHISIPSDLGDISWIEAIGEIGVRIGIHSGEAIGGVIGDKKFSFDLWGDAVNTASRMESHGEVGKIHCSADFMRAVETGHDLSLRFIPRGEMEIKGKGMMKTYFLEKVQ